MISTIIRVAIIDMYNGVSNQGMRCIQEIINKHNYAGYACRFDVYDARQKNEIPDINYDIYISSGGPDSPLISEGTPWGEKFKSLVEELFAWNRSHKEKKSAFFICYSFQILAHLLKIAEVKPRKSTSFGITPIHKTEDGMLDPLYHGLDHPFYVADFRDWQVIQPKRKKMKEYGFSILSLEKIRPDIPLERAVTGIRLSSELVGVQFHPEADPESLRVHFSTDEQRKSIIKNHGIEKYNRIMSRLQDYDFIGRTYETVLPNFLKEATEKLVVMDDEVTT